MATKTAPIFTRQSPNPPLIARNVNQLMGPLEGQLRSGIGKGLTQGTLYGGGTLTRFLSGLIGYARIGPVDIPARDATDPLLIKPGKGEGYVYVRTDDGLLSKGVLEPIENIFSDPAPANWFPVIVLKIDMEVWTIAVPDCVNSPLP